MTQLLSHSKLVNYAHPFFYYPRSSGSRKDALRVIVMAALRCNLGRQVSTLRVDVFTLQLWWVQDAHPLVIPVVGLMKRCTACRNDRLWLRSIRLDTEFNACGVGFVVGFASASHRTS
jgi:hypothetical protein